MHGLIISFSLVFAQGLYCRSKDAPKQNTSKLFQEYSLWPVGFIPIIWDLLKKKKNFNLDLFYIQLM